MSRTIKVKICGLTMPEEALQIKNSGADYCGMVLFFPKSKRNISIEHAGELIKLIRADKCDEKCIDIVENHVSTDGDFVAGESVVKRPLIVAVTVSPTYEQACEIVKCGFDILQIHGKLEPEILGKLTIPIWRAYNSKDIPEGGSFADIAELNNLTENESVEAFLFDASEPGSGKAFNYDLLKNVKFGNKLFILAGGLNPGNVSEAVSAVSHRTPDIVDTSSGVENDNGIGKDFKKVEEFIHAVKDMW